MKVLVLVAVLVAAVAADFTSFPHVHNDGLYDNPASGYQFAYPYRNDFLNGPPMSGSYYVVLPDGRIQVIYY